MPRSSSPQRSRGNHARSAGTHPTANRRAPQPRGAGRPSRGTPSRRPPARGSRGRSHRMWWTAGPAAVVVAAVMVMVVMALTGSSAAPSGAVSAAGGGNGPVPASVVRDATTVSHATLAQVGVPEGLTAPTKVTGNPPALVGPTGKPEVLYVGADYCPFCAAQRWALVVALSHFGTFSGLGSTYSSVRDTFPHTNTFSFHGARFESPSLDFVAVETNTNTMVNGTYPILERPTAAVQDLLATYDKAPYTTAPGSIPFIDIGNRYVMAGSSFSPSVLSGLSMDQIASALSQPSSPVAQAVDGTANILIGQIAAATGVQPTP